MVLSHGLTTIALFLVGIPKKKKIYMEAILTKSYFFRKRDVMERFEQWCV